MFQNVVVLVSAVAFVGGGSYALTQFVLFYLKWL